ncbi:MAG: hypothetical protein V9H25_14705 [Candidatus Competibacter sp.]
MNRLESWKLGITGRLWRSPVHRREARISRRYRWRTVRARNVLLAGLARRTVGPLRWLVWGLIPGVLLALLDPACTISRNICGNSKIGRFSLACI